MAREQVLYQIIKLSSRFICENNLDIPTYDARQAALDGNLVSLGDNIAFQQARFINGDNRSYHEIFKEIEFLRGSMRRAKKEGRAKDARIFWYAILNKLFVKDFVLVTVNKKSEYRRLAKAGFYLNGVRYVRFSASAGQIRHNTVQFCSERIYEELFTRLMCDLNNRITETNIAKLSAYFSLSTSSIMWVSKPRVCIIKGIGKAGSLRTSGFRLSKMPRRVCARRRTASALRRAAAPSNESPTQWVSFESVSKTLF